MMRVQTLNIDWQHSLAIFLWTVRYIDIMISEYFLLIVLVVCGMAVVIQGRPNVVVQMSGLIARPRGAVKAQLQMKIILLDLTMS